MNRERNIRRPTTGDVLHNHIDVDVSIRNRGEQPGGDTGMIRHSANGDFGLVTIDADAANNDIFHAHSFFFHEGAGICIKTAANFK